MHCVGDSTSKTDGVAPIADLARLRATTRLVIRRALEPAFWAHIYPDIWGCSAERFGWFFCSQAMSTAKYHIFDRCASVLAVKLELVRRFGRHAPVRKKRCQPVILG